MGKNSREEHSSFLDPLLRMKKKRVLWHWHPKKYFCQLKQICFGQKLWHHFQEFQLLCCAGHPVKGEHQNIKLDKLEKEKWLKRTFGSLMNHWHLQSLNTEPILVLFGHQWWTRQAELVYLTYLNYNGFLVT
jgi:hypothetical protein